MNFSAKGLFFDTLGEGKKLVCNGSDDFTGYDKGEDGGGGRGGARVYLDILTNCRGEKRAGNRKK